MIQKRLVLDTNVALDLFVFHDLPSKALLDAIETGAVEAVTRADCRDEWLHVLHYPHLPLDDEKREQATMRFDALIRIHAEAPGTTCPPLPSCSDTDDQKFLEIARDSAAGVLITKDKALLKLARRVAKAGMFRILTPQAWLAEWQAEATLR
ncbi:putative toxin-antitoxin system toxin component, PIN family [Noviherbaspirillum pedocola]|uniref:Toxin-antitoxin system toxin component, PIN family n=1 Tax=Noviherbaspirillum pedocola TaxID=2801341 RepID=A0A934SVQ6_9BURK|nr:putative toxin-antitoxin system toxin component, PIN family [Noviherbaspirillum pedocola]MBK4736248.1 putative toxin-antitoxin system toxin component, PIN family [Noviherbaspirillum pedocola]